MESAARIEEQLIEDFPYEIHQVRGPGGELVWVQKGINPDNVFADKRRSDWPFSQVVADQICAQIVEGSSLRKLCQTPGFPSYAVVVRWKIERPDFAEALRWAYEDRTEFFLDKILTIADEVTEETVAATRLKLKVYQWAFEADAPKKNSKDEGSYKLGFFRLSCAYRG